jgi:tripartite-type tricarboxylate transporter receptor subunit TctC
MQGVLVPSGTPSDVVDLLNKEIVKIMRMPDVQAKCAELGFDPVANSPAAFEDYIKKDVEKWGKVIRDAKIPQIK